MSEPPRTTHPTVIVAATAVTIASAVAIASFTGLLPGKSAPEPALTASAEPAPAPAAARSASGPVVQVGAFDSDSIANGEWQRLAGRNGGLFSGKSPVIQEHQSNGRTFWRLRVAGFDSLSEARQFCSALQSSGTDCLALGG